MIFINKEKLDKFSKKPKLELPTFKFNDKKQNLEVVSFQNWQDLINSNRSLTLQEMIERNTYIESEKEPIFADISGIPLSLNEINKESKVNDFLHKRLEFLKSQALKKEFKEKDNKQQEKEEIKQDK